jgi:hypothetical protein
MGKGVLIAAEADAVVRVRVMGQDPVRQLVLPIPLSVQKPDLKEKIVPFTDTRMQVLEVYKGSVGSEVTVMQLRAPASSRPRH